MRTTLTLDDDVAQRLDQLRRADPTRRYKDLVNDALRTGLERLATPSVVPFRTEGVAVGRCLLPSLDDTGSVLEWLDSTEEEGPIG